MDAKFLKELDNWFLPSDFYGIIYRSYNSILTMAKPMASYHFYIFSKIFTCIISGLGSLFNFI